MRVIQVLVCMPYMCDTYMYALYVCLMILICRPYMCALCVCSTMVVRVILILQTESAQLSPSACLRHYVCTQPSISISKFQAQKQAQMANACMLGVGTSRRKRNIGCSLCVAINSGTQMI